MKNAHPESFRLRGFDLEPMTAIAAEIVGPLLASIDPWARYAYTSSALTAFLTAEEADAPRFAIKVDSVIAGAVSIRSNWLRGPYLQFLGILPAYQSHGIGGAILKWFEDEARGARAQNLWVAASEFNTRALSFYERHGFNRTATLTDLVVEGSSEILLRKRLLPA
ncbi:MAG TPA: GNAT family N-acetyltransferase [Hyphomicrobium sp.]|jgi:GNAT superfamily N-acetyltransferase|nr:GNAT family N-acetyltransferase [Hyphomicrobium sp.]